MRGLFQPIVISISFRGGRKKRSRRHQSGIEVKKKHKINEEIRAPEVRLVGQDGEMIGVTSLVKALQQSREVGVDLVEISPKAVPPVCRIIDYGKMLYAEKKKLQLQKKAQKKVEIKGIRLTFRIGPGDLDRQRNHAIDFLKEGHTVRVALTMRGREKAHKSLAVEKILTFAKSLEELATLDNKPKLSGHQVIAILRPKQT